MRRAAAGVLCVIATLWSTPVPAQRPPRPHRSGLWGEFGFGPGRVRVACSGCTNVITAGGATSYFRIGGAVSDHVVIGLEVFSFLDRAFGFSPGDSTTTAETLTATAVVIWFPGRHGLFLKGGVGIAGG